MSKSECALAIEGFASTEPARLRALPEACTLEDAQHVLQPTKAQTPTYLGTGNNPVRLFFFKSEKLKSVRVWVDQTGHVILVDTDQAAAPPEQYFQTLGEPEAHLDFAWRSAVIPEGEHLWLSRGVTIVHKPDYTTRVIRVGIFRSGLTLDEYTKSVQFSAEQDVDDG